MMSKKYFLPLLVIALIICVYLLFGHNYKSLTNSNTTQIQAISQSAPIKKRESEYSSTSTTSTSSAETASTKTAMSSTALSVDKLSQSKSMLDLLQAVHQTKDVTLQDYALNAARELCFNTLMQRTIGFHALVDSKADKLTSVLAILQPNLETNYADTFDKCKAFSSDKSIEKWHSELSELNPPIALVRARKAFSDNTDEKNKVDAIKIILDGNEAAAKIYFLRSNIATRLVPKFATNLPGSMSEDDAYLLARVAIEIGACRAGAPCGFNTIARSKLCMWYGECGAYDVETAYRRLHQLYEVPFEYVDRLASQIEYAIKTKNAALLLGGA
jgi:hypothetical protein